MDGNRQLQIIGTDGRKMYGAATEIPWQKFISSSGKETMTFRWFQRFPLPLGTEHLLGVLNNTKLYTRNLSFFENSDIVTENFKENIENTPRKFQHTIVWGGDLSFPTLEW